MEGGSTPFPPTPLSPLTTRCRTASTLSLVSARTRFSFSALLATSESCRGSLLACLGSPSMNSVVGSVRRGEEGVERTKGMVGGEGVDRGEGSAGEEIGEGAEVVEGH